MFVVCYSPTLLCVSFSEFARARPTSKQRANLKFQTHSYLAHAKRIRAWHVSESKACATINTLQYILHMRWKRMEKTTVEILRFGSFLFLPPWFSSRLGATTHVALPVSDLRPTTLRAPGGWNWGGGAERKSPWSSTKNTSGYSGFTVPKKNSHRL